MSGTVAAVDLGATSGRVVLGHLDGQRVRLETVSRFGTRPRAEDGRLRTDVRRLFSEAVRGVATAVRAGHSIESIGIDSWACDYGALKGGQLIELPLHYRDESIAEGRASVELAARPWDLYQRSGIQPQPFNTIYQLAAPAARRTVPQADRILELPDLLAFWMTGEAVSERTIASTTGLLSASTRAWDPALIRYTALATGQLASLVDPGTVTGLVSAVAPSQHPIPTGIQVTAVGSHDTASAVAAVPHEGEDDFVYISSGTWSLVGCELEKPLLTRAALEQGFTNELGVDGRVRFLHNVMGLWLLTETMREWGLQDDPTAIDLLLAGAAEVTHGAVVFDVNSPEFFPPGAMAARIHDHCRRQGLAIAPTRQALVRSILESLSAAYAQAIERLMKLTGRRPARIHIVGGGSMNRLLCQLTADATDLVVVAGPVEATALGNVLVQARAIGMVHGSLEQLRRIVARSYEVHTFTPAASAAPARKSPQ
jgi:rhamnulokinase